MIDMVQRRAARWRLRRYKRTDSVTTMLEELGCRTLEQRRVDSRLTILYKITLGLPFVDTLGLLRPVPRKTRHTHNESLAQSSKPAQPLSAYHSSLKLYYNGTIFPPLSLMKNVIWKFSKSKSVKFTICR